MRKSTAFLLFVVAALAATSIWTWRALVKERDRAESLQAKIESLEQHSAELSLELTATADTMLGDSDIVESPESADETPTMTDPNAMELRALQNDSYREARRRLRHLELARTLMDLAKVLGISQKTADRLIALLVEGEIEYLSQPRPSPRNVNDIRDRQMEFQQAQSARDAEIAALIGAAKFSKFKEYQSSLSTRHQVYQLGAQLFASGDSLRENQIEPLISVIHKERQWVRQELSEYRSSMAWSGGMEELSEQYLNERQVELIKTAHERIHAGAQSVLSSGQLEVFDDLMRRERERNDAGLEVMRIFSEAVRPGGGAN